VCCGTLQGWRSGEGPILHVFSVLPAILRIMVYDLGCVYGLCVLVLAQA